MQPSVVIQPADQQAAAIQAIADQLARIQKDARKFPAAKDREADHQETLRRTAMVRPPAPAPVTRNNLNPPRGCPIHQLTSGPQRGSLLFTPPRVMARPRFLRLPAPRVTRFHLRPPSPPDLPPPQTSCPMVIRRSRTSSRHILPCPPIPSEKSNSGGLDWTLSSCSKSWILQAGQPDPQRHGPSGSSHYRWVQKGRLPTTLPSLPNGRTRKFG